MSPAKLQQLLQSGLVHHRAGRWDDAEIYYRQARLAAPRNFDALHLSGLVAFQRGNIPVAVELLGRAVKIDPRSAVGAMRYGLALLAAQKIAEGERELRRAVEIDPALPEGWENLAYALKLQDRLAEAVACHQKVASLRPDYALGWYNFGLTLSVLGKISEALECHDRALRSDPNLSLALFGRAQALHQSHRAPEAVQAYEKFLEREPRHSEAQSYRLYALHSFDEYSREKLFEGHREYGRAVGGAVPRAWPHLAAPARRLRVGIISPDLRDHSCAYFLEPLLRHLDRAKFEIYLYHDHFREDAVSGRLRALAGQWRSVVSLGPEALEKTLLGDALDIALDLAGHTGMNNRLPLFARRIAPVQINYLGYPNTTGVPAMDYRFTDNFADPAPEADAFATEKLVRFSSCAWTYQPRPDAPRSAEISPIDSERPMTFGCFNTPAKINNFTLRLWAQVLLEVPGSRLLLKGAGFGSEAARREWENRLVAAGISAGRVALLERTPDAASHLSRYHEVDVALDTYPYHGTTTTCEALWMGVPVVVLAGDQHMSRVGLSLLRAVRKPDWIASTPAAYVQAVAALARDAGLRSAWRRDGRAVLEQSVLLDHPAQAAKFGAALRLCWEEWCRRQEKAA